MKIFLIVAAIVVFVPTSFVVFPPFSFLLGIWLIWQLYEALYFRSSSFVELKSHVSAHVSDCNELNQHIESLKSVNLVDNRLDYGRATYKDASRWRMKRPHLAGSRYAPFKHDCSRQVCSNAQKKPFEYICKYFGIKANEETLNQFEAILNNFEAVEEGKVLLKAERDKVVSSISSDVPFLVRKLGKKRLEKELGFDSVDFSNIYFPQYIFRYTSSGGNASTQCDIVMDIENLNRFVGFLANKIKFKKSVAAQRRLMTSRLRQEIKERDNYTCKICGLSTKQEPHLLLEIDHIIPVSKGGMTTEDNLQTLCWRCNRTKGAKSDI